MTRGTWLSPALLATAMVLFVLLAPLPPAAAHERVAVGDYEFVVGWRVEPPYAGVLNGLDLGVFLLEGETRVPVEGVAQDLTATLTIGPASMTDPLRSQFGRPGWYTFDVIPTREGVYSVRVQGTLDGTDVDFTVELETVRPSSQAEFPAHDPTAAELQQALEDSRALVQTALLVAVLGVTVGAAGLGLGTVAWVRGRGKP